MQQAWSSRGPIACALWPVSLVFAAVTAVRRALYRLGWKRTTTLPKPVIVVGNLVAGGAGKTPTVIAVVALLRRRGFTPGIVSRGYGRDSDEVVEVTEDASAATCGDEPLLLRLRTRAPVVVGRDRVAAARELLRLHPQVDVVVSDDGLQHLALGRTAQVIVFDERGAGNGWLLPAGPLREALPRAVPAGSLILYNAACATTPLPGHIARRSLAGIVSLTDWWHGGAASLAALQSLRGRPLWAAAGLARPQRFFDMLRDAGLVITALPLPDHHDYANLPWPANATDVIVTEKDAVKLRPDRISASGSTPARIWVAALDFAPDAAFDAALLSLLAAGDHRDGSAPA